MSESITHTAVTDDCVRLALHSSSICRPFKQAMRHHLDIVRLGGVTRSGGNYMVRLVTKYREMWSLRETSDRIEEKLAYVLGWHTHRAADLQMKPIFEAVDANCPLSPTDCSVYHDVFLFRQVYGSGKHEPYDGSTLETHMESAQGAKGLRVRTTEDLFRAVWQQRVLTLQAFADSGQRDEKWMNRLLATRQTIRVDLDRYRDAFRRPDPERTTRFIVDINFYDPEDRLIRLARSLHYKTSLDQPITLSAAVDAAASESQYAQALHKGYRYLAAASDYFQQRIDKAAYEDALERGKQGVG